VTRGRSLRGVRAILVLSLLLLTGCGLPKNAIMSVKDELITADRFSEELQIFRLVEEKTETAGSGEQALMTGEKLEEARLERESDRRERLVDQLALELLIRHDPLFDPTAVQRQADALYADAVKRFGGEKSLTNQLDAYQVSGERFRASLYNQAMTTWHAEQFALTHPISASDRENYYNRHRKEAVLLNFTEIVVPTRTEAKALVKQIAEQPEEIGNLAEKYNNDPFDHTSVTNHERVGLGDDALISDELLDMALSDADYFFADGRYHVIYITHRHDRFEELTAHIDRLLMNRRYKDYLDQLAMDQGLQIDRGHIPSQP